jgi:adenine-specific DNA methylase
MSILDPDLFRRVVTPKGDELIASPSRHGGKDEADKFFLGGMKKVLAGIAKASTDFPATIYYAFKQSELAEGREEITSTGDAGYDSETRFALDWFVAKGFDKGKSSDAILMLNAVDLSLDGAKGAGFFAAKGGDARLLKREELRENWDLSTGHRGTVWEACQHLVKRLTAEDGGIEAAAALYNRLGALADPAHALARRLYDICEQKQWASEGRVYNQLHQEWAVIEKRAAELAETGNRRDLFSR